MNSITEIYHSVVNQIIAFASSDSDDAGSLSAAEPMVATRDSSMPVAAATTHEPELNCEEVFKDARKYFAASQAAGARGDDHFVYESDMTAADAITITAAKYYTYIAKYLGPENVPDLILHLGQRIHPCAKIDIINTLGTMGAVAMPARDDLLRITTDQYARPEVVSAAKEALKKIQ